MKVKFLLTTFSILAMATLFMSNSGGRASSGGGDNTGAPPSGAFCQQCHASGAFNPSVAIEVFEAGTTTAITEYVAGTTYDVKITVTAGNGSPVGYGQQTTVLDANDAAITGWTSPGSGSQITDLSGRQFFEHSGISSTGEFTASWTAPAAGTGAVTFYTGANAVDGAGSTAGDGATKSSLALTEGFAANSSNLNKLGVNMKVYPNPVEDVLNLETIGNSNGEHTLTITNAAGQTVRQITTDIQLGMDLTTMNVADLATGLYRVTLAQDGKVATVSILKK